MVSFGEYSWAQEGKPAPPEWPQTAQSSPTVPSSPHLRTVHTREVAGSIPAAPIAQPSGFRLGSSTGSRAMVSEMVSTAARIVNHQRAVQTGSRGDEYGFGRVRLVPTKRTRT